MWDNLLGLFCIALWVYVGLWLDNRWMWLRPSYRIAGFITLGLIAGAFSGAIGRSVLGMIGRAYVD